MYRNLRTEGTKDLLLPCNWNPRKNRLREGAVPTGGDCDKLGLMVWCLFRQTGPNRVPSSSPQPAQAIPQAGKIQTIPQAEITEWRRRGLIYEEDSQCVSHVAKDHCRFMDKGMDIACPYLSSAVFREDLLYCLPLALKRDFRALNATNEIHQDHHRLSLNTTFLLL